VATNLLAQLESVGLASGTVGDLATQAAAIDPAEQPMLSLFARAELEGTSQLLRSLNEQEVTYEGEEQHLLLGLSNSSDRFSVYSTSASGSGSGSAARTAIT
jgi:hypothetical protein